MAEKLDESTVVTITIYKKTHSVFLTYQPVNLQSIPKNQKVSLRGRIHAVNLVSRLIELSKQDWIVAEKTGQILTIYRQDYYALNPKLPKELGKIVPKTQKEIKIQLRDQL
jgi:hypothetical protein